MKKRNRNQEGGGLKRNREDLNKLKLGSAQPKSNISYDYDSDQTRANQLLHDITRCTLSGGANVYFVDSEMHIARHNHAVVYLIIDLYTNW